MISFTPPQKTPPLSLSKSWGPSWQRIRCAEIVVVHVAFMRTACPHEAIGEFFSLVQVSEGKRKEVQRKIIVMGFVHVLSGSLRQDDVRLLTSLTTEKFAEDNTFCLCEQLRKEFGDVNVVVNAYDYDDDAVLKAATSLRSGMHLFNAGFVKACRTGMTAHPLQMNE